MPNKATVDPKFAVKKVLVLLFVIDPYAFNVAVVLIVKDELALIVIALAFPVAPEAITGLLVTLGIVTSSKDVGKIVGVQFVFVFQSVLVAPVQVLAQLLTLTEYVAVAFAQGLLLTVMVNVTVWPASPITAVYTGLVVAPEVMEPNPLCVQAIVPFVADAPLTVDVPFEQVVWLPPADAVGL